MVRSSQQQPSNSTEQTKRDHNSSLPLIHPSAPIAANCPSTPRMRHPPIMRDAKPPITIVDTRARSTQQNGLHSSWDQERAGKAKRVAKTETAHKATKITTRRLSGWTYSNITG